MEAGRLFYEVMILLLPLILKISKKLLVIKTGSVQMLRYCILNEAYIEFFILIYLIIIQYFFCLLFSGVLNLLRNNFVMILEFLLIHFCCIIYFCVLTSIKYLARIMRNSILEFINLEP